LFEGTFEGLVKVKEPLFIVVVALSTDTPVGLNDTLSVMFLTVSTLKFNLKLLPRTGSDLTCPTTLIVAGLFLSTENLSELAENVFPAQVK